MPDIEEVKLEKQGGVATITLNRPEKLNALTFEMVEAVTAHVKACSLDPDVRVVVIRGAGRAFCSGDDIVAGMGDSSWRTQRYELNTTRGPHYDQIKTLMSCPKPV